MTPLLSFEEVCRSHPDGDRELTVFDKISFSLDAGAFAGVYGGRRTGKSTLLRLAAGIELPDDGCVRFDGVSTKSMSVVQRERMLRGDVGIVFADDWHPKPRESVVDYVAFALGSEGVTLRQARRRARRTLVSLAIAESADEAAVTLSLGERVKVMVARALVRSPRLLLVDEPAAIPNLGDREELRGLLRTIASEIGATLIVASEEMGPLNGADLVMSIGGGELCVTTAREPGRVVPFPGGRGPSGHAPGGEAQRQ